MRSKFMLSAMLAAAASFGTAHALTEVAPSPVQQPSQGQAVEAGDASDPIECRKEADSTSRIRKYKVCKHMSEWEARSASDQATFEDMRNSNINPCVGDGKCGH